MCGIAGIFGNRDRQPIRDMTSALRHRGPDSIGYYYHDDLHLGIARLSIIDVDSGDQPIFNESGDKVIVFNGEIYNFKELRKCLLRNGHCFRTRTDTEVVLHLYEEHGENCVHQLQGMFAFAIFDGDKLFLARDRLGIKPLYHTFIPSHNVFLFASEIKALLRYKLIEPALDMQAFADSIVLTHPLGPRTYFKHIYELQPGRTMTVKKQEDRLIFGERQYYEIALKPVSTLTFEEGQEQLLDMLASSVASHLVADVGIALSFSGGLDSSLLALFMNKLTKGRVRAFTTGPDDQHPDVLHARLLARQADIDHEVYIPTFADFLSAAPRCLVAEERPTTFRGATSYLLYQRIGRDFKVALNGEGSDELFGGYQDYDNPDHFIGGIRRKLPILERLGILPSDGVIDLLQRLSSWRNLEEYAEIIFDFFLRDRLVRHHLEVLDKYSMSSSLEMRVPYMDHKLVEFANSLPISFKLHKRVDPQVSQAPFEHKFILKQAARAAFRDLIEPVAARRKLGFPSSGVDFRRQFNDLCEARLPPNYLSRHELGFCFSRKSELLVFELFTHIFVDRRGELPGDLDIMEFIDSRGTS